MNNTTNGVTEKDKYTLNRLASVGQIAAGIAHEVRNPLTAVKGFLDLLKTEHPHTYIDIALQELDHALDTMQNLLNVAKPDLDDEELTYVNLTSELEATLYLFENQKYRIQIETDFKDTQVNVYGKKNQLKKAFFNLIKNAFEAIPEQGKITIKHFVDGNRLIVSINDTGVGIPEDKIELLGTPFYTSKESGTGMGLAQVFSTIYEHNGKIQIESEVGLGTSFTIEFPIQVVKKLGVTKLDLTYIENQSFQEYYETNKDTLKKLLAEQGKDLLNSIRQKSVKEIDDDYILNTALKIFELVNGLDEFGLVMLAKEHGKNWAKMEFELFAKLDWYQTLRKLYWDFLYNYYDHVELSNKEFFELQRKVTYQFDTFNKHFSASFSEYKSYLMQAQNELIEDLNVPIIPITDTMAILPIIGTVDTKRAKNIQINVLEQIHQQNIKNIIIDLSGVSYLDTAVLGHLFNIINGIRIQGCKATLTGVRPEITNTIVELGIQLHEKVQTRATLKEAIQEHNQVFKELGNNN